MKIGTKIEELKIGSVFNYLTVEARSPTKRAGRHYAVRCVCGARFVRSYGRVKRGIGCRSCSQADSMAAVRATFKSYMKGATKRFLVFDLTFERFCVLTGASCHYCGAAPRLTCYSKQSAIQIPLNGVDRKDNAIGYTVSNSVSCCGQCNRAKSTMSEQDFRMWAGRVAGRG
jgi:glutaredoxin